MTTPLPEKKTMVKTTAVILMIVLLLAGVGAGIVVGSYLLAGVIAPSGLRGEVKIGALLDRTGPLQTFGKNEEVGIDLATADVNKYLTDAGAGWSIRIIKEETGTNPVTAQQKTESLFGLGVRFIIGPMSSGEIGRVREYANANKIVLISQSSTAPSQSFPNDYVFRLPTNDTVQGKALSRLMVDTGVKRVVQIYRNDDWGVGLSGSTMSRFDTTCGTGCQIHSTRITYSGDAASIADVTGPVDQLNTEITSLLAPPYGSGTFQPSEVAVELLGFEEAVFILKKANDHANLKRVQWFGSDGTAFTDVVLADSVAAAFSENVTFANTIFGSVQTAKFQDVHDRLLADPRIGGREVEGYTYAAYDAVWIFALALQTAGRYDSEAVWKILTTTAENYFGATGPIELDSSGDRLFADYDVVVPVLVGTTYRWDIIGIWSFDEDKVTFVP